MDRGRGGSESGAALPVEVGGEFQALAEHLPDSVARFDRELRYLYGNPAFQAATGLTPEQFLGRTHAELEVPSESAALWDDALRRTFESGEPQRVQYWHDGARGERRLETRLIPEFGAQGVQFVLTVTQDITERWLSDVAERESRARVEASEARIRSMFDSAPIGIYTSDAQGRLTFANRWLLDFAGLRLDDVLNEGWMTCVHPDDLERVLRVTQLFLEQGGVYDVNYRFLSSAGERTVRVKAAAVMGAPAARGYVGTVEDVTEHLKLEEQLRQRQKMEVVGRLAGGVAHDFNNLLTVILNGLGLIKPLESADKTEMLRQVELAAERAATLTMQLLAFGRKTVLRPRVYDINLLVTSVVGLLRRVIAENVRLEAELAAGEAPALVDVNACEQVLMNLVLNARDASPPGGTVSLRVERVRIGQAAADASPCGDYVRVTVRDTGSGIAPEHLPHIFEPFYTTKEVGRGTGLGLATVHGIVEQHHGWVDVRSELGRGTEFSVYLPEATAPAKVEEPQAEGSALGGDGTILLVEDEVAVRAMIRASLERSGYRVLEASDPIMAKKVWSAHSGEIDLLLTDQIMPGRVSGQELAAQLRVNEPALRVIIMSGHGGCELQLDPGTRFIQKPFPMRTLGEVVRECLRAPTPPSA